MAAGLNKSIPGQFWPAATYLQFKIRLSRRWHTHRLSLARFKNSTLHAQRYTFPLPSPQSMLEKSTGRWRQSGFCTDFKTTNFYSIRRWRPDHSIRDPYCLPAAAAIYCLFPPPPPPQTVHWTATAPLSPTAADHAHSVHIDKDVTRTTWSGDSSSTVLVQQNELQIFRQALQVNYTE